MQRMDDYNDPDLPQPGDDPEAEDRSTARDHPTSGPGNVSVDEPTATSLEPDGDTWAEDAGSKKVAEGAPPGADDLTGADQETETD